MSIDHWLAFTAASAILLAIPGPTILLVVSYALAGGRRTAAPVVAGVALGDFVAMTTSLLGLGVLLSTSAVLFMVLKWIGAAYLIYLGARLWLAPAAPIEVVPVEPQHDGKSMFAHAFAVTVLNPKSIVFFIAFLPQFLDYARPAVPQMIAFEATFLTLAVANAALYAWLAATARGAIRRPSIQRLVNRVGGSLLIAAGLATVAWRRASAATP
jgi:threonine/homoserine/homoserine lactone efflux protein